MGNPKREQARTEGFLMYVDENGIALLEKGIHQRASVFVEAIDKPNEILAEEVQKVRYKAHYTRWDEEGKVISEKVLYESGEYEKAFEKAINFANWMQQQKANKRK